MGATMERVSVNGVELEFHSAGSGEAVVFIHGAGVAARRANFLQRHAGCQGTFDARVRSS